MGLHPKQSDLHMGPLFPDFLPISFSDTFFYLVKKSIPRHFQDDRQCLSLPGYFVPPRSYSGAVVKNLTILCDLWNRNAILYPQIMTKPRRKKIWDAIFLFRTITPLNTTFEKESLSAMVKGGVVRKRKIKSQIFFLLGLVMICGQKSAVRFQR